MKDGYQSISMIRKQRHDFMNDIQIIYGYLQLEDYSEAKKYLEKLCKINSGISELYSLGDVYMAYSIENLIKNFNYREINIDINVEIDNLSKEYFKNDFDKKNQMVNNIIEEIENLDISTVSIYVFENGEGKHLLIYNEENVFQNIIYEKNNCSVYCDFDDIQIIKYQNEYNIGFSFNFK